ncbi:Asp-tRNA(Asn)/Glu-tRNA(Gln) amidotransferase subunit GatC [Thermosynechococcus sp. QKsg1]|uniref:Asp-tRNA(Asn)/Glu-tRNA(Gln) amidotransferase subunit GatC n=1 Tax=unclassified Thermosynechococcus TaxID=2622553 RepID=UPI00257760B9|nr:MULTISPECIES: Asp-tRNA(Asn)/Glu-tRNA(Gln) amidotransferase subunit GatC [unclassified Thermosynechococcus]WJI25693.1 Asp-tRNA(Asn)/Glu-tRNA(Gln) amidotransferase subunit GatC [Thermosynechococcus sp. B1]WKT82781.1 Asp-tRNA(Asn)/Glu-tRNA(Gln) amidotransferase subunit GatC [Thermosynechococcus sp. HY596]WNC61908.1 Asp-tRNA(Asn)/Glu-tRNA(Gln) amidotransferase subunit GatC [Thermosynechococcus sp. HY591]WNC64462.1 Asp-tRNA(Asn)/Glu-tRNA(Gln) amidotransferase subunit GatC [Thermosynechococcus sp.
MATKVITAEDVRKVAHLARLALEESEIEALTQQLDSILDYVNQLSELDVTDIPPTTRAIEVSNVTRPDVLEPWPNREDLLAIAPDREDDFFRVPKIM